MHPELFIERNVEKILTEGGVLPGCCSHRVPGGREDISHHAVLCQGAGFRQVPGGGQEDGQAAATQYPPAREGCQKSGQAEAEERGESWVK